MGGHNGPKLHFEATNREILAVSGLLKASTPLSLHLSLKRRSVSRETLSRMMGISGNEGLLNY